MTEWKEKREIHQITPRKFSKVDETANHQAAFPRLKHEATPCPLNQLNQDQYKQRAETLDAIKEMNLDN